MIARKYIIQSHFFQETVIHDVSISRAGSRPSLMIAINILFILFAIYFVPSHTVASVKCMVI